MLAPSIYPRGEDGDALAERTNASVAEAVRVADRIRVQRHQVADPRPAPAVYPYARALVEGGRPLSRGQLAAGIQLAAGLGAEGVVLWGSSGDYQACAPAGCALVRHMLDSSAGPLVRACVANRDACAAAHCSGRGRCVDYTNASRLEQTCLGDVPPSHVAVACRCDRGYGGERCARKLPALLAPA